MLDSAFPLPREHAGGAQPIAAAIASALRNEQQGWGVLFDRFYDTVHRYALARSGDRSVAEEIAQEVFVAAVKALPRLREHDERSVEAWFIHIARNKLADRARRGNREARLTVLLPADVDPADVAAQRLATAELQPLLDALTGDQREVLIRRFILDQPLELVARSMRRRLGAVKALQHRAIAAMQRSLQERDS